MTLKAKIKKSFSFKKRKTYVMHKYFEEHLGGRWTNLFKMILYNRKFKKKWNKGVFMAFPNGQEKSMINYFSEMFFFKIKESIKELD